MIDNYADNLKGPAPTKVEAGSKIRKASIIGMNYGPLYLGNFPNFWRTIIVPNMRVSQK